MQYVEVKMISFIIKFMVLSGFIENRWIFSGMIGGLACEQEEVTTLSTNLNKLQFK